MSEGDGASEHASLSLAVLIWRTSNTAGASSTHRQPNHWLRYLTHALRCRAVVVGGGLGVKLKLKINWGTQAGKCVCVATRQVVWTCASSCCNEAA